jgi:hypothetical protein
MTLDGIFRETTSFLFDHPCEAWSNSSALIVTVPAEGLCWRGAVAAETASGIYWYDPEPIDAHLVVSCEPGSPHCYDGAGAAEPVVEGKTCTFAFMGNVYYGRVPTESGWALHVVAPLLRTDPDARIWQWYAAVEIGPGASMARGPARRPPPVGLSFIERFHRAREEGATVRQAISWATPPERR